LKKKRRGKKKGLKEEEKNKNKIRFLILLFSFFLSLSFANKGKGKRNLEERTPKTETKIIQFLGLFLLLDYSSFSSLFYLGKKERKKIGREMPLKEV